MSLNFSNTVIPTEFIEALDTEPFKDFLRSAVQEKSSLLSITLPIAGLDPLAALELNPDYDEKFFWDHPENSISIAAAGAVRELKATGNNRFEDIAAQTAAIQNEIQAYTAIKHSMAGPLFLGGYSFNDYNIGKVWKKFGAARFILPEWMLVQNGNLYLLTLLIDKKNREAGEIYHEIIGRITDFISFAGKFQSSFPNKRGRDNILCTHQLPADRQHWINRVEKAKELIREKKFSKIVLARSVTLESRHDLNATVLAHNLREKYPECYNFLIQPEQGTAFIGATPERLASFKKGLFLTEGLAGSTSRGKSAVEDAALAHTLMESKKDRIEHQFVVRAIDDSLKPFSMRVDHPDKPHVKKLNNVQHLYTPIQASIKEGVQIHELIKEMHPTPAVGGFPREKSVSYIQEIEQIERGWYSAPIGWFNMNGCGEFAVAIRSALLHNNRADLFAGCGIVADSDPENEWNETLMKFQPMMDALNLLEESYD